jgi:hypothetical protein
MRLVIIATLPDRKLCIAAGSRSHVVPAGAFAILKTRERLQQPLGASSRQVPPSAASCLEPIKRKPLADA